MFAIKLLVLSFCRRYW